MGNLGHFVGKNSSGDHHPMKILGGLATHDYDLLRNTHEPLQLIRTGD
jgi:hypothetical protein